MKQFKSSIHAYNDNSNTLLQQTTKLVTIVHWNRLFFLLKAPEQTKSHTVSRALYGQLSKSLNPATAVAVAHY